MLRMRKERLARGWTQKQVGEKCDVGKQAINNIELGTRNPSYKLLVKLENLFGMTRSELMESVPS